MRPLIVLLGLQVLLALTIVVLVATGNVPFVASGSDAPGHGVARTHFFDGQAAWRLLKQQVAYGPRPAGSPAERAVAEKLRRLLPHGRFQAVPGGLRNVIGTVPGRDPRRYIIVGGHYDTKDVPLFVGANNGAAGAAAVVELARGLRPRTIGPTVQFILFDGEESPRGTPDDEFLDKGLRGSRVAARVFRHPEAVIVLDLIAGKRLSLPREESSDAALWSKLRAAANRAGLESYFPDSTGTHVEDDHTPFLDRGVHAIDLVDWDFPCIQTVCDNLSAVSERSLDASGEAVAVLLRTL